MNITLGIKTDKEVEVDDQMLLYVSEFLGGEGVTVSGVALDMESAIKEAKRRFPKKPYCIVTSWILVDVSMRDASLVVVETTGRKPRLVYAHEVVKDEAGRFDPGWWVRSTYEVSYDNDGFFETGSTIYVLMGEGLRKTAFEEVIFSIH